MFTHRPTFRSGVAPPEALHSGASTRAMSRQGRSACACGGGCPKCRSRKIPAGAFENASRSTVDRPPGLLSIVAVHAPNERDDRLHGTGGSPCLSRGWFGPVEDREDEIEDQAKPSPPVQCRACTEDQPRTTPHVREDGWFTATSPRGKERGALPPLEAGWWTGDWYKGENTIICDGSGSLTIHEATSYKYGVQECTRLHEAQHRTDWYARYGNDICKKRAKGDLPYFDPPGKDAYSDFKKKSECAAWKIGRDCRQEKLGACGDDACKKEVQGHVDWANDRVKHYCG